MCMSDWENKLYTMSSYLHYVSIARDNDIIIDIVGSLNRKFG